MPVFQIIDNSLCQGRLSLASGYPVYAPLSKTPSATDTTAETVDFASDHGWTTGTMVTPSATGGGLTALTIYYINATDANTVSFHTTFADADAGTSKVNLTASITAQIRPFGVTFDTLYWEPHKGNLVSLYTGSEWVTKKVPQTILALSSLTAGINYDAFLYDNAGTVTLELTAWTSDLVRATALVMQDGVEVKTGATTRRYVGMLRAIGTTTGALVWSPPNGTSAKIFLWNRGNQVPLGIKKYVLSSHTYNGNYRDWNNDATNRIEFVSGLAESGFPVSIFGEQDPASGLYAIVAAALDSTTTPDVFAYVRVAAAIPSFGGGTPNAYGAVLGYHYIAALEQHQSGTGTFYDYTLGAVMDY